MIFPTAAREPRPVRLSEQTRMWAWESLHGRYGDEAIGAGCVYMDDVEGYDRLPALERYDRAVRRIAEQAPIRLCEQERVCGAATLGEAIFHNLPAFYQSKTVFRSVSHLTIRYDYVLTHGLAGYEREVAARLEDPALDAEQRAFLHSLQHTIDSIRVWHGRYLEATEQVRPDLHRLLKQVPFSPARTFHEALQSLWFIFAFVRLCGNWPGIGRIDLLLGTYLENDLRAGVLDRAAARELLASFFIKGCEWIRSTPPAGSGDAQHYQNLVLSGVDADGNEIANAVTKLVLEVVEELAIADFPITVRLNSRTPDSLKQQIARVMRHGGGIVAIYNEELILRSLTELGYAEREARLFANDGCWEVQIPGKTEFAYHPFDALQLFNRVLGLHGEEIPDYQGIEEIYTAFIGELNGTVDTLYRWLSAGYLPQPDGLRSSGSPIPTSVISLFEDGCIRRARSYYDGGPEYQVHSPHIGGAPDVANSLYAIQKLVFEEKKLTLSELIAALRDNWEGHEALRLYAKNRYTYYGNDEDEADRWHTRVLNDFAELVHRRRKEGTTPFLFIPGVSTFGRQIEWLPARCATAFGAKQGEILSGNDSPVPGTDVSGATAVIRSHCKADLGRQTCGAALDVKIFPASVDGENGLTALVSLMDGFLSLGGFFMQLDTVDVHTLREAQKHPQNYKTLSVRVSGWNARFVTLDREWQNMIIERTAQNIG